MLIRVSSAVNVGLSTLEILQVVNCEALCIVSPARRDALKSHIIWLYRILNITRHTIFSAVQTVFSPHYSFDEVPQHRKRSLNVYKHKPMFRFVSTGPFENVDIKTCLTLRRKRKIALASSFLGRLDTFSRNKIMPDTIIYILLS